MHSILVRMTKKKPSTETTADAGCAEKCGFFLALVPHLQSLILPVLQELAT